MIGVFPEYEWRISTPNQLARRIQKVYNLSLNMSGIHQNKVREAPDVTARPIEPTHPRSYLWKKSGFSVPHLSLTDSVVWPQNLMLDPITNAQTDWRVYVHFQTEPMNQINFVGYSMIYPHLQMMFPTKWPHTAGIQSRFQKLVAFPYYAWYPWYPIPW